MLKNYFKTAWRNISKNKISSAINIVGLALGICSCIVIFLITKYEFSFDNFHPGKERIYRVMGDVTENTGNKLHFARLPLAVSQNGRNELSGLDGITGVIPYNVKINIPQENGLGKDFESRLDEKHYSTTVITEPEYFEIFIYNWLAGDATTALNAPFSVVLTENKANQYFGTVSPDKLIGRKIIYGDSLVASVSGIVKDWSGSTDLAFTDFISSSTLQSSFLRKTINTNSWAQQSMNSWTFVKLSPASSSKTITAQMSILVGKHAGPAIKLALWLEPLSHIHFNPDVVENQIRTADKTTLYSLIAIALFILILAVINFINLSTARSMHRAKEVGVRKVLGSSRESLIFQFLTETLLLTLFAVLLAVLLVNSVLAAFRSFIPDGVVFYMLEPSTIIFLVLITLITSSLAGFYPAKVLSSHLPALSLKGIGVQMNGTKGILRKGLIIFQFMVSIVFIVGAIVINRQLTYTSKKERGFSSDAIITVATPWNDSLNKITVLAEQIKKLSAVSQVALQWLSPMTDNGRVMQLKYKSTDKKEIEVGQVAGNEDFIPLYQIKLLAGRNLQYADSVKEFIINESFLHFMGYEDPKKAIGKILYWNEKSYPVIGVVADFHSASFHDPISPLCIINRPDRQRSLAIKMATTGQQANTVKATLSQIEKIWKRTYPAATFQYQFYDEALEILYEKDRQTATLMNTAMAITIIISCIGLFGLAFFMADKKAKEIGIRKILGAGITNIMMMLSKDFLAMVAIAFLIASPVAWYFANKWLQNFTYHINIGWWVFILAVTAATFMALLAISFQVIKAAVVNPVKSLRSE